MCENVFILTVLSSCVCALSVTWSWPKICCIKETAVNWVHYLTSCVEMFTCLAEPYTELWLLWMKMFQRVSFHQINTEISPTDSLFEKLKYSRNRCESSMCVKVVYVF